MLLTENGYIYLSGQSARYHFFIRDHLGSNRVIVDEDGSVEQVNHYYPFVALFGAFFKAVFSVRWPLSMNEICDSV
jgi:hypothetical protein